MRASSPGTARGRYWLTGPGLAACERWMKVTRMTHAATGSAPLRDPETDSPSSAAPQSLELRHLRYFVAVADAGTFTRAAERLFVAQPTLSQQIRRLEQIVGTPLLYRRRDGVRLTAAGTVLLAAARDVLAAAGHAVAQARQAAGLGQPRLRFVLPPDLPECLAVQVTSRLRSGAGAAGVALAWLETALDAEFAPIRQRRADAGLGWLTASPDTLPSPLEAITQGQFEPEVWIPSSHPAARRGMIGLDELAGLEVIHGPRRASPATYDRWLQVLRGVNPRFEFTDPPFRHSLPMALAFAATASRPTAVLTGPAVIAGPPPGVIRLPRPVGTCDMTQVSIPGHPLTATAALVWNGDLPRPLQQILFDTADGVTPPDASSPAAARPGQDRAVQPTDGEAPATWAPQLAAGRSLAGLCPAASRRGSRNRIQAQAWPGPVDPGVRGPRGSRPRSWKRRGDGPRRHGRWCARGIGVVILRGAGTRCSTTGRRCTRARRPGWRAHRPQRAAPSRAAAGIARAALWR
jgi:DNA-binding transcriptional LysR family regulator